MNTWDEGSAREQVMRFDLQALGAVYDCYSPQLYRYALRLLGDENLAEDCVAETFSRFLNGLRNRHGPDRNLQAYLYRIAHNWITDQYRRMPPPTLVMTDEMRDENDLPPEHQVSERMEKEHVRNALRMLTPDQRQVIILRFYEGWENDAVADAIGKPVGAVKALQHRGLAALRKLLSGEDKGT